MSRKREKEKVVVRVPNPKAPVKERLKTPSHKVTVPKRRIAGAQSIHVVPRSRNYLFDNPRAVP